MWKETITYKDFNGVERTEDFYFNINQAEAMEMELSTKGGLTQMVNEIVAAQDSPAMIKVFKDMISASYGKKSLDGREFIKSEELTRSFVQTRAYSQLYMKLVTDHDFAAKFFNGIVDVEIENKPTVVPPAN